MFSLTVTLLVVGLSFSEFPQNAVPAVAKASVALPFTSTAFSNGTISPPNSPLKIWYTWIDVSGTQLVNYAMYTAPDYPFPVPIASLIGQHVHLADGSDVFVISALDGMEVYRNSNGDGIPDSSGNQILYFMYSNMSDAYKIIPITGVLVDGVTHYQWGFTYQGVYAYLQSMSTHLGVSVRFKLDHLTLTYDFSVNANTTNLKTGFDIGRVSNVQTYNQSTGTYVDSGFSFDGLSLSLLYASETYASASYSTYVNRQPYNSTTTTQSSIDADSAGVSVVGAPAYDFVFGGNYTLTGNAENQTHVGTETYDAKTEIAAPNSLPFAVYGSSVQGIGFFSEELDLTQLFGGSWPALSIQYSACSFVYRLCFPTWNGQQVTYDPLYIGHLSGSGAKSVVPEFPVTVTIIGIVFVAEGTFALNVRSKRVP